MIEHATYPSFTTSVIFSTSAPLWGIDLGGTKIEGVILDPSSLTEPLQRLRVPTQAERGYDHLLSQIVLLIEQLEMASGLSRPAFIGVGTPGVMIPKTGMMKNSNTLCLNGQSLASDLATQLSCKVILANDANCCALAESLLGAGRGSKTLFGIILGTGVGGGIVVHGEILSGEHGIAGEWGHNPLCGEETPCYCGRLGCLETVCAGPSLEKFYAARTGLALRLPEIANRATSGDADAVATLERLKEKFAEALGAVINLLDPDVIVIGGGVGNLDLLYTEETRRSIARHLFNDRFETPLLRPALGDSAGVFGAALLTAEKNH
jgi:N-acetylglucosamine kinase